MPAWGQIVAALAALRVIAALCVYFAGLAPATPAAAVPHAVYVLLLIAYAGLGIALIVTGRNDVRAAWLGAILLLIVSPFTNAFVRPVQGGVFAAIDAIRPDAFLAAALWRFAIEFPEPASGARRRRLLWAAHAVTGVAAVFAAINLSLVLWPAAVETLGWRTAFVTWPRVRSWYWPVLFLFSVAAIAVSLMRMFASRGAARARTRIFVTGLAIGILPFLIEVIVEELVPAYKTWAHSPGVERALGAVLFSFFATVPLITTYSVIYDRVVDTRLVVRAALQYALARYSILGVTAIPFAALALYLNHHREQRLIDILSGWRPALLIGAVVAGSLALRLRRRVLRAVDRRFFREAHDTGVLVSTLIQPDMLTRTPQEMADRLRQEIDRVLHARADLYVIDDDGATLREPGGGGQPLSATSTLMALALADARPMDVDLGGALSRLPAVDRQWLAAGRYVMVMAVKFRSGEPAGLLALGGKRSELRYTAAERHSLHAIAAPLALAIENDRLRRGPEPLSESPARECTTCSRLYAVGTPQCHCGGSLIEGTAPHTLRGIFRLEQRIGAGGMGVVYRAIDLNLGREVAIKTLPRVTPEHAMQLKREAQAMASLIHANLAVIYGIESWRGTPFLVEEYLAGGMLSHRLRRGPQSIEDTLDLGVALARVLGQLHASGIVHCDIKPSNIGFAQSGTVKLVDFGLAYLLRDAGNVLATTITTSGDSPADLAMIVTARGLLGTPAYMSPEATLAATPAPSFDLWGLCVVLFEMATGQRPFRGQTADELFHQVNSGVRPDAAELRPDCPPALALFFRRALAVDRSSRPQSAADLERQLLTLRSDVA